MTVRTRIENRRVRMTTLTKISTSAMTQTLKVSEVATLTMTVTIQIIREDVTGRGKVATVKKSTRMRRQGATMPSTRPHRRLMELATPGSTACKGSESRELRMATHSKRCCRARCVTAMATTTTLRKTDIRCKSMMTMTIEIRRRLLRRGL